VPIIAGWYTVSCDVVRTTGPEAKVVVRSTTAQGRGALAITQPATPLPEGQRLVLRFYTREEGSKAYTRDILKVEAENCEIDHILFEKMRPGERVSVFGEGTYIDRTTPPAPGELVEP
jgi:hypothetical protein